MLIAITMTKYNKKSENNKRAHKVKIKMFVGGKVGAHTRDTKTDRETS
jgi:hypothetical protein